MEENAIAVVCQLESVYMMLLQKTSVREITDHHARIICEMMNEQGNTACTTASEQNR